MSSLYLFGAQGPVPLMVFHHNSNSMEILFHSNLDSNIVIATKLCTWHDSCAVMACAKICCHLMASNGIMARRSFHRICISGKKLLVIRPSALPLKVQRFLTKFPILRWGWIWVHQTLKNHYKVEKSAGLKCIYYKIEILMTMLM